MCSNQLRCGHSHPQGGRWFPRLVTVLLVAAAGLAVIAPPSAALKPVAEYKQTPEEARMAYDEVFFETTDNVKLHGWFMPFQDWEGDANHRPGPIIILPSPDDGNMGDMLWHYYTFFRGTGWHVLLFDWRGFGSSDPWPLDEGAVVAAEFITDLNAAIDFAKTLPSWDEEHIGIYAFNMGAAVSMAVVSSREDVDCLAVRGIYTNQEELAEQVRTINTSKAPVPDPDYPAELEPLAVAPKITTPTWVIAGNEDPLTTASMGKKVYDALGNQWEFWVAHGAGHTGTEMPENVLLDEFKAKLHAFMRRFLGAGRL